jgi:glutamyl-tRNA synthetase
MPATVRTRFAPSPTGRFHIGGARTALYAWLFARHHGGVFALRIEDTDQSRCRPEYLTELLDSLRWLGLDWDEGPEVGGPYGPYIQSERLALYQEHAARLVDQGAAYKCYCPPERLAEMRAEQQRRGQPPGYDRRCRALTPAQRAAGAPSVIRFAVPLSGTTAYDDLVRGRIEFDNSTLDDFVILKSDGFPTYHLANVVDDHAMAMTHVLRAEEWISSTPRHLLMYEAFGFPPPQFAHLPLILGPDRAKLSKRHGATAVQDYREEGFLPEAVRNFIALLGWSPGDDREVLGLEEMIAAFGIEGIGRSPAVFDVEKLRWMNGVYLRALAPDRLVDLALPQLQRAGLLPGGITETTRAYVRAVMPLEQERLRTLSDLPGLTEFFFRDDFAYEPKGEQKWLARPEAAGGLSAIRESLAALTEWTEASVEGVVRVTAERLGVPAAQLIHPTRVAVTGRTAGPGLFATLAVLGRERVLSRLDRALRHIAARPSAQQ